MTTKRRALLGGTLAPAVGALAACAAAGGDGAPGSTRPAVTLEFWSRMGQGASRSYVETGEFEDRRLAVFAEQRAPVKVNRTVVSNGDELLQKLTVAFVGGTGPDVFNIGSPGIAQLAAPGFVLPLDADPRVKREAGDFFQSGLSIGTYKQKLYGLTYYADMRLMIYRKDRLAEAGLPTERKSLPRTWEQLVEVGKKLARWEGGQMTRFGFGVPRNDESFWLMMVKQLGKEMLSPDLTRAQFDGPEGERALQTIVDFIHRDRIDAFERPNPPNGVTVLATDIAGSTWDNSQQIGNVAAANLDPARVLVTDFAPEFTPRETATGYLGGTWVLAGKQNKSADATVDLLLFLASPEQLTGVTQAFSAVPPRRSMDKTVTDPLLRPFYEAQDKGWSVPGHPKFSQLRVKIREVVLQAMRREKSVKEAVSEMAAFTNTTINSA
ncbi:MAG TPA: extracellular solute-binding protein [Chloroflexota bacterium]|nr:extracellular solute-binding protein [Chloroflexota bacterium]